MLNSKLSGVPSVPCSRRLKSIPPERCPETSPHSTSAACIVCIAVGLARACAPRQGLRRARGGVMFLQDGAAGSDGSEHAVGDVAGFHGCQEFVDYFIPGSGGREGVGLVVGDYLDIAFAERD